MFSDWCGWHNDHGSLTALVPAMYLTKDGAEIPCPDPSAGLYIRNRSGELVKAVMPKNGGNNLLFQIGETAQIHTGKFDKLSSVRPSINPSIYPSMNEFCFLIV